MEIRRAKPQDLPALVAIYNYYVDNTVVTFDLDPFTVEERRVWFDEFDDLNPLFVCTEEGTILGYAYYQPFRQKRAYAQTKECTVYVSAAHHGRGVGKALYAALIDHARARGVHALVGVLGGANEASAALHHYFGFELVGHLREVGNKFGSYVDTFYYEKLL